MELLPTEIHYRICSHLSTKEIIGYTETCTSLNIDDLWKLCIEFDFHKIFHRQSESSWRLQYFYVRSIFKLSIYSGRFLSSQLCTKIALKEGNFRLFKFIGNKDWIKRNVKVCLRTSALRGDKDIFFYSLKFMEKPQAGYQKIERNPYQCLYSYSLVGGNKEIIDYCRKKSKGHESHDYETLGICGTENNLDIEEKSRLLLVQGLIIGGHLSLIEINLAWKDKKWLFMAIEKENEQIAWRLRDEFAFSLSEILCLLLEATKHGMLSLVKFFFFEKLSLFHRFEFFKRSGSTDVLLFWLDKCLELEEDLVDYHIIDFDIYCRCYEGEKFGTRKGNIIPRIKRYLNNNDNDFLFLQEFL